MKATINGITVEGTPQEIMEYQRLKAQEANKKPLSEVCKDIGRSLGVLMAVSHHVDIMNQQLQHRRDNRLIR